MSGGVNDLASLAVRRPMLALVLNLLIILAGIAALLGLDVRELPDVDRPVVSVEANYPGAAPNTVDAEVTGPLEDAVARAPGVRSIEASSEEASSRLRVEFNPGTDINTAAADVREAVNRIRENLPARVEQISVVKADAEAAPIMRLAVRPDQFDNLSLTERIENDILPRFMSIEGVASVEVYGARTRQMRVVIEPLQLARFGLTIAEVADALRSAPYDVPVGSFTARDQQLLVRAQATAATPELMEAIWVRDDIRIGDIGQAYFAPADAENFVRLNGDSIIGLGIIRQASANTVDISTAVAREVRALNARFDDLSITIESDDAVFISSAIREVLLTLGLTTIIVVLSIWTVFGTVRATLVPALAIPTALIGSLAGLWLFGFSINLITLLALVLATGLIVDDAIVVLENVQRQQDEGVPRRAAAVLGTRQVFFAVIATSVVLIAVFLPISFLQSPTGQLFQEFGFVLALSVAISTFVALTLAPAIAAKLPLTGTSSNRRLQGFGAWIVDHYLGLVERVLVRPRLVLLGFTVLAVGAFALLPQLPQELTPEEDRGAIEIFASGPDGVGIEYMQTQADQIEAALAPYLRAGDVRSVYTVVGRYDPNRVLVSVQLAPWSQRSLTQAALIAALEADLSTIAGSRISVFARSSFEDRGNSRGGLTLALTGADYPDLYRAGLALSEQIEARSTSFESPELSYEPTQPQLSIRIDRQAASDLGVPLDELAAALRFMVGGEELVDLNIGDQAVPVYLSTPTGHIRSQDDLMGLYLRTRSGALAPLSTLTEITQTGIAAELDRTAQRRAIQLEVDVREGVALGDAMAEMSDLARQALPDGLDFMFVGTAQTFRETSQSLVITYVFALAIVLLVLIAQFENLTSPMVVMGIVPFGLAAAILALLMSGTTLNIFSQIGLVLLIGLMAKNGILFVEFADQQRRQGAPVRRAILQAARLRLRPITLTIVSTVLGAMPLVLASGAGAEAREAIGWTIVAGLALSVVFTLVLTPALYRVLTPEPDPDRTEADLETELRAAAALQTRVSETQR